MACGQHSSAASRPSINVMFLCDEWKSSKGGLSTFNREFAVNLAKTTSDSVKVHCYVSQSDELSREDARQHGVKLITARHIPGSGDQLDWLKIPPPELPNPDIVVGHGRKFGTPAYFIVQTAKCKWMHFVHVFCEDLGKFKATQSAAVDTIEENEKKHKREIELCKAADVVVAVGSRLQRKYSKCLPHAKVEIITPGIFEKFSNESSQLIKDNSVQQNFSVFMFGRASFEDLSLKGYDIVANAIGSLGKTFDLTFVGSSSREHRKIEQWFLDNSGISQYQITIRSYCNEQDELNMMFEESDMVAIPSRTEGFGLVALEAISAGIPVLIAGETGIAEALLEVEGGKSVVVESDDPEEWAQRMQQLSRQSPEEREYNAKLLRDNYNKTYSWDNECERFKRMIQDLAESSKALKLKIDVETMTPAKQNTQDRTPVSAEESGGSHTGGHQELNSTGAEAPQAPNLILTDSQRVLSLIASNYLLTTPPRSKADRDDFVTYMKEMRVLITGVDTGSLLITVQCDSLEILETLWEDYSSGHLGEVVQRCFVTEEILTGLSLAELKLQTTISEEEYIACKMYFEKDPVQENKKATSSAGKDPEYKTESRSASTEERHQKDPLVKSERATWQKVQPRSQHSRAQREGTIYRKVKHGTPKNDEIEELGYKIEETWKRLGRRLHVSNAKLREIDQAHDQLSEKGYYMLKHWKHEKRYAATYQALSDALKHKLVQREDLAVHFCYRKVIKRGTPKHYELRELGCDIVELWKRLGRRLHVSDAKLREIDQAYDQLSKKGYYMLKHWRQEKGSAATYQALCDALKHRLVQREDLAVQICYIKAPADPAPGGTVTGEVSGATARTCDSGDSSGVRSGLKRKSSELNAERAPADPAPGGTVTGEVSGATARTRDSGDSYGVRSHLKRKRSDPNPERGIFRLKISATSRNVEEQDPQEQSETVNRYMAQLADKALTTGLFDLSTNPGLQQYSAYLLEQLNLVTVHRK